LTPAKAQSTPSFGTERLIIFTNHPIHFFRPLRPWEAPGKAWLI
jgi:hypothetical protein